MKKETSLHWYKEEDEIVPETPPSVASGACAVPIPLVTTAALTQTPSLWTLQYSCVVVHMYLCSYR